MTNDDWFSSQPAESEPPRARPGQPSEHPSGEFDWDRPGAPPSTTVPEPQQPDGATASADIRERFTFEVPSVDSGDDTTGDATSRSDGDVEPPKQGRSRLAGAAAGLLGAVLGLVVIPNVLGNSDEPTRTTLPSFTIAPTTAPETTPPSSTDTDDSEAGPSVGGGDQGNLDLVRSTVQIVFESSAGPCHTGSGTIVSADGLVITNHHVASPARDCPDLARLSIMVSEAPDRAPVHTYNALPVTWDEELDLAVLQIVSTASGGPFDGGLDHVPLGNSDTVEIGDDLTIVGYPGTGGETVTLTSGEVSGFTNERRWIKTDASFSGGNSGGLGANIRGEIIGVPTIVGSGGDGSTVDCRPLADTNGDGRVDGSDTCVPVGGFINALRPVNFVLPLLDDAARTEPSNPWPAGRTEAPNERAEPPADVDWRFVGINEVFDDGSISDPVSFVAGRPHGACVGADVAGVPNGVGFTIAVLVDGELSEALTGSHTWDSGIEESHNGWCFTDSDGLRAGVYEVLALSGDELFASTSFFVGGDRQTVEFEIVNDIGLDVCWVYVRPTGARFSGVDRLGENILRAGDRFTFSIASGLHDVDILDCSGDAIFSSTGEDLPGSLSISLSRLP